VDAFSVDPAALALPYQQAAAELERVGFAAALWARSADVWPGGEQVRQAIANRLGWLNALDFITPQMERLRAFAASVRDGGFTDVVLLGMGGSSLAPEVFRQVVGVATGYPRFRMLDSTDPDAVRAAMERAGTTLFILASKSGSTIEPNVMATEAQRRVLAAGHPQWGSRFVAITDENTLLHRRAVEERLRDVFVNPSDIGGRYSALSYFGMVPAAAMGIDLDAVIVAAREMERLCREPGVSANPGLALGALMAAGARHGRDKLTLRLPERLQSFGLWIEQLVAESTGKAGKGIVPIAGEPLDRPAGHDRIHVTFALRDTPPPLPAPAPDDGPPPAASIALGSATEIGAEFLRWEVATAAAGLLMAINPFDEPNVQQAKEATRALLDVYVQERRLPMPEPLASIGGVELAVSQAAQEALGSEGADTILRLLESGDYFCLLAFLPPDDAALERALQDFRADVGARTGCATMFGYGPRYLHSTGQLHKGGPNTGVFVILTADPADDLGIPGEPLTFGVLEMAQAVGDFQSLDRTGRRALHARLPDRDPERLRRLLATLTAAI
jgi:glucose-6-phosphate isomerase